MKKLFFSLLLLPLGLSAQKFDISARGGVSSIDMDLGPNSGFCQQVSVGYRLMKHLSLSAIYEHNRWGNTSNNSFGISPDYTTRYFYFGADIKLATISVYSDLWGGTQVYHPSYSYGIHAGAKQWVSKHLAINEQIGYQAVNMKVRQKDPAFLPYTANVIFPESTVNYEKTYDYLYLQAGLSYSF